MKYILTLVVSTLLPLLEKVKRCPIYGENSGEIAQRNFCQGLTSQTEQSTLPDATKDHVNCIEWLVANLGRMPHLSFHANQ